MGKPLADALTPLDREQRGERRADFYSIWSLIFIVGIGQGVTLSYDATQVPPGTIEFKIVLVIRLLILSTVAAIAIPAFRFRNRFTPQLAATLGLMLILPSFVASWFVQNIYAQHPTASVHLAFHKMAFIVGAGLSLGYLWVNVALVALTFSYAALFWHRFHDHFERHDPSEPFSTILVGFAGTMILIFHYLARQRSRRLAVAGANATAYKTVAAICLSIRDGSNTPLQALEFGVAVLDERPDAVETVVPILKRSIDRLRSLGKTLSVYEEYVDWGAKDVLTQKRLEDTIRAQADSLR